MSYSVGISDILLLRQRMLDKAFFYLTNHSNFFSTETMALDYIKIRATFIAEGSAS